MKYLYGYNILSRTRYAVTNTLVGCTSSNSETTVNWGSLYSAVITASSGYTLEGATISITMGGTDITNTAYSNGTITIAKVTGALVISILAVQTAMRSITSLTTACKNPSTTKTVADGDAYSTEIHVPFGYQLLASNVTIIMGGVDITSTALSGNNISIASVTGDVVITAEATSAGLAAGLYQNGELVMDWATIKTTYPSAFNGTKLTGSGTQSYLTSLSGDLVIGSDITELANAALNRCTNLTNIFIPSSVTTLSGNTVNIGNINITELVVPSSITEINRTSFSGNNKLEYIYYNSSATTAPSGSYSTAIQYPLFENAGSESASCEVIIGQGVTAIMAFAFTRSYITKINIPASLTQINSGALNSQAQQFEIEMQGQNSTYQLIDNCLVSGSNVIFGYGNFTIPTSSSITTISAYAFVNIYTGTTVTIPDNITTVSEYAFADNITTTRYNIGTSVATIGNKAFGAVGSINPVCTDVYFYMNNLTSMATAFTTKTTRTINIYCKSTNTTVINYDWTTDKVNAVINQTL